MEAAVTEFFYRLPGNTRSNRPGAHRSSSRGAGMNFVAHAKLMDLPDPRRLDLRASIASIQKDWLVRVNQQRVAIKISVIVDVSPTMHFQGAHNKIDVIADFLQSLGYSAVALGDSIGLQAFDHRQRDDLAVAARFGRGVGQNLADLIRHCKPSANAGRAGREHTAGRQVDALSQCIELVADSSSLVFIISDFHWPLTGLGRLLDPLAGSLVVPLVMWDRVEIEPPAGRRLLSVQQMGARSTRHVWLTPRVRQQWRENVRRREQELTDVFASRDIKPFTIADGFDAEALSKYFMGMSVR